MSTELSKEMQDKCDLYIKEKMNPLGDEHDLRVFKFGFEAGVAAAREDDVSRHIATLGAGAMVAARDAEVADLEHERDNANGRSEMLAKDLRRIGTLYAHERNDHGKTSFKLAKLEAEYAEESATLKIYIENHRRSIKSVLELVEALEMIARSWARDHDCGAQQAAKAALTKFKGEGE